MLVECPIFLWIYFANSTDIEGARTQIFLLFVLVELIIAMSFRSLRFSLFEAPPHKWLWLAMGWELALLAVIVYVPFLQQPFGSFPFAWTDWALTVGLAFTIVPVLEAVKWLERHGYLGELR